MNPAVSLSRQALLGEGVGSPIPTNKDCQDRPLYNMNVPKSIFTELILSESNFIFTAWATHNFLIVF